MAFDSEAWKSDPGSRFRMLDDLLDHHELVGMPAERLQELLSPWRWGREDLFGSSYHYGLVPPVGALTSTLIIDLDPTEQVARYRFDWDPDPWLARMRAARSARE